MEIAFMICLKGFLLQCREERIPLLPSADVSTPMACQHKSSTEIAKYMSEHPRYYDERYYVRRWTCQKAGQFARL